MNCKSGSPIPRILSYCLQYLPIGLGASFDRGAYWWRQALILGFVGILFRLWKSQPLEECRRGLWESRSVCWSEPSIFCIDIELHPDLPIDRTLKILTDYACRKKRGFFTWLRRGYRFLLALRIWTNWDSSTEAYEGIQTGRGAITGILVFGDSQNLVTMLSIIFPTPSDLVVPKQVLVHLQMAVSVRLFMLDSVCSCVKALARFDPFIP